MQLTILNFFTIGVKPRTSVRYLTIISFKALNENLIWRRLARFLRQLWHARILDFDVVEEGESVIGRFVIIDGTLMEQRSKEKEGQGKKGRKEGGKRKEERGKGE